MVQGPQLELDFPWCSHGVLPLDDPCIFLSEAPLARGLGLTLGFRQNHFPFPILLTLNVTALLQAHEREIQCSAWEGASFSGTQ